MVVRSTLRSELLARIAWLADSLHSGRPGRASPCVAEPADSPNTKIGGYRHAAEEGDYVELLDEEDEDGLVVLRAKDGRIKMWFSRAAYDSIVTKKP